MLRDLTVEPAIERTTGTSVDDGAHGASLAAAEQEHAVVAVVGLGYVGLPTAIALRDAGFRIVGIDTSASRLRTIAAGEAELLRSERDSLDEHLAGDGFVLTDRGEAIDAADLVLICVPTPVGERRRPDPRILREACASVVRHARPEQTIVLTSTTYVGCTRELLVQPLAERGLRAGEDVFVAFAPERIDPGVDEHSQTRTPRVLGGVSETCSRRAADVLAHTCERLHRVSSPEVAELVKLYENTFRAVNIALAFELAEACHGYALDPIEVTEAAASKPYGFLAHYPSAGVGGHCIGVDPHYLVHPLRERGRPASVAEEALRKLAGRPRHVVCRAHETLVELGGALAGARVLVVGASYKPGVADAREAPSREIVQRLLEEGASVDYHDPLVPSMRVGERTLHSVTPDPRADASGFGPEDYALAIVVTVHPEHDYGWLARCPAVLDCTYRTHAGRLRMVP
ncbi:MAG TPA: nucleotide sugar dehydrogenase [Solirubrobacteraceae bacterium]|jgi:nucleotide sugar dehydrogenase|nr:nucleotide sugar dehydrogenase [Solirubrobacteraceae bacterium]